MCFIFRFEFIELPFMGCLRSGLDQAQDAGQVDSAAMTAEGTNL